MFNDEWFVIDETSYQVVFFGSKIDCLDYLDWSCNKCYVIVDSDFFNDLEPCDFSFYRSC